MAQVTIEVGEKRYILNTTADRRFPVETIGTILPEVTGVYFYNNMQIVNLNDQHFLPPPDGWMDLLLLR